jgi:hypothetical protein
MIPTNLFQFVLRRCILLAWGLTFLFLQGCSSLQPIAKVNSHESTQAENHAAAAIWQPEDQLKWEVVKIPGKVPTQYSVVRLSNRPTLMANASSSASMLRKDLRIEPGQLNALNFSWQIQKLIEGADMAHRDSEDSPVRLVLAFDGDRSQFSPKNAMLSELTHALTGQPMPYATLMYVWCNQRPVNSVIQNPRTDRIRKIVVESGAGRLNQWINYERDIRADYEKAFGEPPGALIGIGIMTDSDNTRSQAQAWYGPIALNVVSGKTLGLEGSVK